MTSTNKVILAGCGNMGRAMLQGWLADGIVQRHQVLVVEPVEALRQHAETLGVTTFADAQQLPEGLSPSLIVLAVKPQVMFDVTPAYEKFASSDVVFVSVAAGVRSDKLEQGLGDATPIVRVMPNTPAAIAEGMMVIYYNQHVAQDQRAFVERLMNSSGETAVIEDEDLMDAVTAVSGSGPAYIFHFIEALRDAALEAGLPRQTAELLAQQTVYGAARYAKQSEIDPGTLREQVTSPGGTTAAALEILMGEGALKTLLKDAVKAAKERSQELGR